MKDLQGTRTSVVHVVVAAHMTHLVYSLMLFLWD
jgi:hypothetical protein